MKETGRPSAERRRRRRADARDAPVLLDTDPGGGSLDHDELLHETVAALGFAKRGSRIVERVTTAIQAAKAPAPGRAN